MEEMRFYDVLLPYKQLHKNEMASKTPILRRNASTECTTESYLVTDQPWLTPQKKVSKRIRWRILATAAVNQRIRVFEI